MYRIRIRFSVIFFSLSIFSCSVAPSPGEVDDTIRKFFEERKCRVIELQIGTITSLPLDQKTYMGRAGHTVEVRKITLQVSEDLREYRKGELLTFSNGAVSIREKVDAKKRWMVVNLSGIIVP